MRLGNIFGGKPVILVLAYFRCPNLCGIVLNGLLHSVRELKASAGSDYDVVAVSIDPNEPTSRAADKKASCVLRYARPGTSGGWHFLTGGPAAIERLTNAVGFRYFYDEASQQFAHPSGIVVVTPQGRISQYLLGIEYPPQDLSRALQKASRGEKDLSCAASCSCAFTTIRRPVNTALPSRACCKPPALLQWWR